MWNKPTNNQLSKLPPLYSTEEVALKEKIIQQKYFIAGSTWFACEYSDGLFFGFVILNNDYEMAEWGYFSLEELSSVKVSFLEIDRDLYFEPRQAQKIPEICKAQNWNKEVMTIEE